MYKYNDKDVLRIYKGGSLLYERYTEIIEPMLVTPSDFNISISSVSDLEIDWGDGTIQTVKSGDDTTLEIFGLISNKYTHTYTDSYIDKIISVKHLDGESPIQFFSSGAIKTVHRWYSEGHQPAELLNPNDGLILNMTFYGLGSQLETVPNIAPPKTTVLSGLFHNAATFNQDLSGWDVSNVTSLSYTFTLAKTFNQPLNTWDVSNVTDLSYTFAHAEAFNQDISMWDVSNVTDLSFTFTYAKAFDQPLDQWDVSSVTDMLGTFNSAIFNQPLSSWNTSSVTTMGSMFEGASNFNQPLNTWNVSNVTNMIGMFTIASAFNQDLSDWCVAEITEAPVSFAAGVTLFTEDKHPVWGTCPRGENTLTT